GTAFLVRAIPTVLALALLDVAMGWNGLKGAAFTVLGSSALAVIGFFVAIMNLKQFRLVGAQEAQEAAPPPLPPAR
ncbi:MAG: lipopolysaccharide biosynthesis protein, partial [Alphaproteobacteria bacterium]|nr:lipopolysaccharide biosynthesis protein [Alphaproteobacteria bacterium]